MNDEHDVPASDRVPGMGDGGGPLDLVEELLLEDPGLAAAADLLPAALEPVALPEGAWHRLAAAVHAGATAGDTAGDADADMADAATGRRARGVDVRTRGSAAPRRPRWTLAHPLVWLAAAAIVGGIAGLGVWGVVQSAGRARLLEEQRVLSYWMANPDMRLVALRAVGESEPPTDGVAARLGVVCILPDGRALLLQPGAARRGETFVVVGRGAGEDADLAAGPDAMLRFDLAGSERLVIMVASGSGERTPVAWAPVN